MSPFGNYKLVKCNKDCVCIWCGQSIPKGSKVQRFKGKSQGDWQNWKMHDECFDYADENDYMTEGFSCCDNERPAVKKSEAAI